MKNKFDKRLEDLKKLLVLLDNKGFDVYPVLDKIENDLISYNRMTDEVIIEEDEED